jgi:hypothetical protein
MAIPYHWQDITVVIPSPKHRKKSRDAIGVTSAGDKKDTVASFGFDRFG